MAALECRDGRVEARVGEVLERGEHAAVDLAGLDVLAPARVDVHARVAQHTLLELLLRQQQHLADREVAAVLRVEGVLAGRAVDRRGLEELPAVEDRLGIDQRRALAGRADLEEHVRGLARVGLTDAAEDRPAHHVRAAVEAAQLRVLRVEPERA